MIKKLILLILLFPLIVIGQNKTYDNLDVKNKLYVGADITTKGNITTVGTLTVPGDLMYKDQIYPSYLDLQAEFTAQFSTIADTTRFVEVIGYIDTTNYVSVNDTVTLSLDHVSNMVATYTSNNSRASFDATGADTAHASYSFPGFGSRGSITGAQLSIEYKAIDTGYFKTYFQFGSETSTVMLLLNRLGTDTIHVFGGSADLLGLDALLSDVIAFGSLDAGATLNDMVEDTAFSVTVLAADTTLQVDHIKLRFFYTVPKQLELKENDLRTIFDIIRLEARIYPPIDPVLGMIYVDTDTHIYMYNGTAWKRLDN